MLLATLWQLEDVLDRNTKHIWLDYYFEDESSCDNELLNFVMGFSNLCRKY